MGRIQVAENNSGIWDLKRQTRRTGMRWMEPFMLQPQSPIPAWAEKLIASWESGTREIEAGSGDKASRELCLLAQTHPVPCPKFLGPLKAKLSHLGSSGREPALRVAMFSPVSRPNMFEALCSWAWIPAGSKLRTESVTHSKQALVCTGLYHLFRLSPTWYMTSSLFKPGEVRLQ